METMKHPTPDHVQTVIDNLKRAFIMAGGDAPVNMDRACVKPNHPCGTPHCHAGWYLVATLSAALANNPMQSKKILHQSTWNNNNLYDYGGKNMARDLGFIECERVTDTEIDLLCNWAKYNPIIWGNIYGDYMFCDDRAFGEKTVDSLTVIIKHWEGVKIRLIDHLKNNPQ